MHLNATLTRILPLKTGMSPKGPWQKQDIIVETEGLHPKSICVSMWGGIIEDSREALQIGSRLSIWYMLDSREYNDHWYTDVRAFKIDAVDEPGAVTDNLVHKASVVSEPSFDEA